MTNPTVGFIGIGKMGWPMAANLARAGFTVLPWDSDASVRERFAREFGTANPASIGELSGAPVIVTMLPTGAIVRQALTEGGARSLAQTLAPGSVVVDMSSSEPIGTQAFGELLVRRGVVLVDAPVSGGVARAVDGSLAIMIGSNDEAAVQRAEPVLKAMGQRLFRTGASGSGHAMKALNNLVSATQFGVVSEALIIGRRFGLDPAAMVEVMNASTGRSFATEIPIKQHVLTGTFNTGFALGLMTKDVKIASELADGIGVPSPIGHLVHDLLARAGEQIGPQQDHTRAFTCWEQWADATRR
jgi:3-hydroxyisobutyrate dehydrogenase